MVKQVLTFARGVEGKYGTVQLTHLIRDIVAMGKQTFPKSFRLGSRFPKIPGQSQAMPLSCTRCCSTCA